MKRSLQVLIIDDCPDTADSVARLMDMWGHNARIAHDGGEAIALAMKQQPDVVLLDIGLPGMTGWEVARQLRKLPGLEQAFMIAVSGFGQADDIARSLEAGCDLHLVKPVAPEFLHGLLRTRQAEVDHMSPDQLIRILNQRRSAADIVEAIDDGSIQRRHGWDLSRWQYKLVPWGVRFQYDGPCGDINSVVAVLSSGIKLAVRGGLAPSSSTTIVLLD